MADDSEDVAALLKLTKSVMLDGTLIESEADDLRQWMGTHPDLLRRFPGQGLCEVLGHVLEDGDLRDLQREELSALLEQLRDSGLT